MTTIKTLTNPRPMEGVVRAIRAARSVAVASHVSPDGDTLGAALALCRGLGQLGLRVAPFCQDPVPQYLSFLPGAQDLRTPESLAEGERFDLLLCVDVSDEERLGRCAALKDRANRTAQLDHHGTNPGFCQENCVDPGATATALLAKELLRRLGCPLDREMAICLYVGVCTDSGGFAFNNTTAEAFRAAGDLMDAGLPLSELNRRLFRSRPPEQVLLLHRALETLRFEEGGSLTTMTLTRRTMEECGALPEHTDMIVNYGLDIRGVKMTAFLRENGDGTVKASLRSVPPLRVDRVAATFGGGGHAQAAGVTMRTDLNSARALLLARMKAELKRSV